MSSRFLKLTNFLINVNQIRRIDTPPNEYIIHIMPCQLTGFTLLGSGSFASAAETYKVTEKDHILDYKLVSDWIKNEENRK